MNTLHPTQNTALESFLKDAESSDTLLAVVTLILPLNHEIATALKTHIKSHLLTTLKSSTLTKECGELIDEVVALGIGAVPQIDMSQSAVALLITIDKRDGEYDLKHKLFYSKKEVSQKCVVSHHFNRFILRNFRSRPYKALVCQLQRGKARLYGYETEHAQALSEIENSFITEKENEYIEKFSPKRGKLGAVHGTGSETVARMEDKEDEWFSSQIADLLSEYLKSPQSPQSLIVLYSHRFTDHIDSLIEMIKSKTSGKNIDMCSHQTNVQTTAQLEEVAHEQYAHMQNQTAKKLLKKAEDSFALKVSGAQEVLDAAQLGELESVLFQRGAHLSGKYDAHEDNVFIGESSPNEYESVNVFAYIAHLVQESGGSVVLVDDEQLIENDEIVGVRRFARE